MLAKEQFITIMESLQKIDKVIHVMQDLFDFNMDDGPLVKAFDDLSTLIIEEMELDIDDDIGPVIFHYAFVNNWGETEFTLNVDDATSFKITDLDTLYRYLSMKYKIDKNQLETDENGFSDYWEEN